MRVLIQMGDSYPDESPCAKRMRTFHDIFVKNGDEVIVLAPLNDKSVLETEDTIYCKTVPLKKKTVVYRLLNSLIFAYTSYHEAKRIKKVDVVITTSPPPLINWFGYRISKYHKAKLIYDVRDIWPDVALEMGSFSENSIYYKVFRWIRDFMLRKSDMTIAVSPGKVKKIQGYNLSPNVIEITNGLDEEFIRNDVFDEIIETYGIGKKFTICYIGNLGLAQGLLQLLEVAKKAQLNNMDVQFLMFGSGAEENKLKEYVKNNELSNVLFPGRIPNKYIYTVLKESDICFVSLVNEKLLDSVPTKLYEALGAGCPVLLAACGDSAEILKKSRLGIAVKPNDAEGLWNAFLKMHDNIDEYKKEKDYALQYVLMNYSRQDAAEKLRIALHKLLNEEGYING